MKQGVKNQTHFVDVSYGWSWSLGVVRLPLAELGRDVAWRAHHAHGLALARQDLAYPEVADLHVVHGLDREKSNLHQNTVYICDAN